MNIRIANVADALAIAGIHVAAWRVAYRGQMPDAVLANLDVARRATFWRERVVREQGMVFVAEDREGIIGFCDLIPSRDEDADKQVIAEIAAIYVHPAHWRKGAGRALCDRAIAAARTNGSQAVTLWVLETNLAAKLFYGALGFTPDGSRKTDQLPDGSKLHEARYRLAL